MELAHHEARNFVANLAASQHFILVFLTFSEHLLMHQDFDCEHVCPILFYAVDKPVLDELYHCGSQL